MGEYPYSSMNTAIEAQQELPPLRIRVNTAVRLSGLARSSIYKAMKQRLFKSAIYCLGKGNNRVRLIDYASFKAFLNNLPEDL